jgi:AAA domain
MSTEGSDINFVRLAPDAARRARAVGVNQAPPEELYGHGYHPEHQEQEEQPPAAYSANGGVVNGLTWVNSAQFMDMEEEPAQILIGTSEDMLLPAGGTLMMYGDGGAGKTTLTLDAMTHLATGTPWLDQPIPEPLRIILIENEGPRPMLRERLRALRNGHGGWEPNVDLMLEPWMGFSFRAEWCREDLATKITEFQARLVIVGPLVTLGTMGGGTPDEVSAFDEYLKDTRARVPHAFSYWIVHHENKAGGVSGAWERLPDTLVHVSLQAHGRTHVHWRKTRWSSELQGTRMNLTWTGAFSFQVEEPPEKPTPEDILGRVRELYTEADQWRTMEDIRKAIGAGKTPTAKAVTQLTEERYLIEQVGPPGRSPRARCWCVNPTEAGLTLDSALDSHQSPVESSESSTEARGSEGRELDSAGERDLRSPGEESSSVTRPESPGEPITWESMCRVEEEMRNHAGRQPTAEEVTAEMYRRGYSPTDKEFPF